ncbi:MAG: histidine--tRNA ligase, partial [Clostridia bacterium]|nr:histidine--tRNA ligase [Clostridia bacterium]
MINIPKGTKDVLPSQSYKWHYIEGVLRQVAHDFCVSEVRTPTFEHTELFARGVGDTTDIVNKEMYTFEDKGGRSMTLKPEGTAGIARLYIENSLSAMPQPLKMYYITPVFRYERPQAGRLREHHQFGIEVYGAAGPQADVEVISIAKAVFDRLGIGKLVLNINSIGCPECRKKYNKALYDYLSSRVGKMCDTCKERLDKNPLRILDCKEEKCKAITADAPVILDYLCDDCKNHHIKVCEGLEEICINYIVNPRIVRGLDYYTRTVFEFISDNIGAQGAVCAGGRYDNLVSQVGGKPTPAVGFG